MASIFPYVQVTQIRTANTTTKPTPGMVVGVVGPRFKRITENRLNAYAINPETAPSIAISLNSVGSQQYVDFDSVEVQLKSAATKSLTVLNNKDTDVIEKATLVKSGIEVAAPGFYKSVPFQPTGTAACTSGSPTVTGTGTKFLTELQVGDSITIGAQAGKIVKSIASDTSLTLTTNASGNVSTTAFSLNRWVFLSSLLNKQVYGALPGDFLYFKVSNSITILDKIRNSNPILKSAADFTITAQGGSGNVEYTTNQTLVTNQYKGHTLVAINKNDRTIVKQYQIASATSGSNGVLTVVDASPTTIAALTVTDYDWYVYDMPLGALATFVPTASGSLDSSNVLTTSSNKYAIYNYNLRISTQGFVGKLGTNSSVNTYYFQPDTRINTSYFGVNAGDYLRAKAIASSNDFRFRITQAGSNVLKTFTTAPDSSTTTTFVFPSGTIINSSEYLANKSFIVARNKTNSNISFTYEIVSWNSGNYTLTVVANGSADFSDNPTLITLSDYDWFIYDSPANSLILKVDSSDFTTVAAAEESYDFTVINAADFYVSGKEEVTILNHISDENGDEIGLADAIITYNVLETENSSELFDITNETLRITYCGDIASYNPLGLASALLEVNTQNAYKVIPVNIALSERDPDNQLSYTGRYYPDTTNANYHDVTKLDWDGAKQVLSDVKDVQIPYYLIPLTSDRSVQDGFASLVGELADPAKYKEMLTFLTTSMPTSSNVFANINYSAGDFSVVSSKLRFSPSTYYKSSSEQTASITFLNIPASKGDFVSYYDSLSGDEKTIKITNIYPTYFELDASAVPSNVNATKRISIKKIFSNKSEVANALVGISEGYNSYRVKLLWGDSVDLTINGTVFTAYPMFYGAVAYAGMASNIGTPLPKTNRPIAGLSRVYNVTPYFSDDDLEVIGSGFLDILTQDFDGGPVYSKRQFMTDGSELSGVEVVDKFAKYFRQSFRPLLGKNNIDASLFDVLGLQLSTVIEAFVPAELDGLELTSPLTVFGPEKDKLKTTMIPHTKRPFNGLELTLLVD